jgi:hypothetical protein
MEAEMTTTIPDNALDHASVTPPDPAQQGAKSAQQDAGQDADIVQRLEDDPQDSDAQLDRGLDESMDASDPPSSTQPMQNDDPPASSGYNAEEERLRSNA